MKDLRELPKFRDGISYIYVERCKIEKDKEAIAIFDKDGKTPIPCASLAMLMVGPGVSITSEAIKNLVNVGCLVVWCGEEGVRFYAQGMGKTRSAKNLLLQAYLATHGDLRLKVVRNMYEMRFKEKVTEDSTIQQLRGLEGSRVRKTYETWSKITGIQWKGRNYDFKNWTRSDPVNRALSAANSCLYGLCHAAIVAAGYTAAIGFLHTGQQLSFVYDIADLYKTDITIPLAFKTVKEGTQKIETRIRYTLRDSFKEQGLLKKIIPDIEKVLTVTDKNGQVIKPEKLKVSETFTGFLWDPKQGIISSGKNYSDEMNEKKQ